MSRSEASAKPNTRNREDIPETYRWRLEDIFANWTAWHAGYDQLDRLIERFGQFRGTRTFTL